MPKTQSTPQLTVYRTGLVNLNGEATRLMHATHRDVDLLPPSGWRRPAREATLGNLTGARAARAN